MRHKAGSKQLGLFFWRTGCQCRIAGLWVDPMRHRQGDYPGISCQVDGVYWLLDTIPNRVQSVTRMVIAVTERGHHFLCADWGGRWEECGVCWPWGGLRGEEVTNDCVMKFISGVSVWEGGVTVGFFGCFETARWPKVCGNDISTERIPVRGLGWCDYIEVGVFRGLGFPISGHAPGE